MSCFDRFVAPAYRDLRFLDECASLSDKTHYSHVLREARQTGQKCALRDHIVTSPHDRLPLYGSRFCNDLLDNMNEEIPLPQPLALTPPLTGRTISPRDSFRADSSFAQASIAASGPFVRESRRIVRRGENSERVPLLLPAWPRRDGRVEDSRSTKCVKRD